MTADHLNLWILFIALLLLVFSMDDFFLDLILFFKKLKPKSISLKELERHKDKPLAIMIANWQESEVLFEMVEGNFSQEENYHVFLGVYPNDVETKRIATEVAKNKNHVHVIVNEKQGPTYKGQMLNVILKEIFKFEEDSGIVFEGFVLHDSEDVLSKNQINLYRTGLKENDFVQTPVLSLPLPYRSFVGSTYIDEFVEMHIKELLVREHLGAALPSAGVGTCISRALILRFLNEHDGEVFLPNALTEDYNLGLEAKIWGYKSSFVCCYLEGDSPDNLIATREYFPNSLIAAIKQKTRWTIGIAFQGFYKFGWFGDFWERYFLWRDRKVILSTLININAFLILIFILTEDLPVYAPIRFLMLVNIINFSFRMGLRSFYVSQYFGVEQGILSVLRWPVSIFVNTLAGLRAIYQSFLSQLTGKKIKWSKTKHKIPKLIKKKAS